MKKIRKNLLGVRIGEYTHAGLLDAAMASVHARAATFTFACANPHSLVTARRDLEFRAALQECSAVVADGVGVTAVARAVGLDVGERITGADFYLGLMQRLSVVGGRVFFLGSRNDVLAKIAARVRREYPTLHVDVLSPPYGDWDDIENERILQRIHDASPDVLWVGMTAPKQEKWVRRNVARLGTPVIGSIGAVFDFYAGTVQRAPAFFCDRGLEWLYRLVREPQRLWRRTLVSAPVFIWLAMREQWQRKAFNEQY